MTGGGDALACLVLQQTKPCELCEGDAGDEKAGTIRDTT